MNDNNSNHPLSIHDYFSIASSVYKFTFVLESECKKPPFLSFNPFLHELLPYVYDLRSVALDLLIKFSQNENRGD